ACRQAWRDRRACRRDPHLRAPENRAAPRPHGRPDRRDPADRGGPRQRQGDDDGRARLHRARRRYRRPSPRHDPASRMKRTRVRGGPAPVPAHLIASWFGAGHLPRIPGTWGSLAALPFAWAIAAAGGPAALAAAAGGTFFLGWWAAGRVSAERGIADPGSVVIDEVVGQWLVLAATPRHLVAYAVAFALFRAADIVKPWPAS